MTTQGFDPEEIEHQLAVKLTKTALQDEGSVPATRQALDVLDRIQNRQVAREHRRRMAELADQPQAMARYLGYLGEPARSVRDYLGRDLQEEEALALEEGRRQRQLELRAVELDRVVRGQANPTPWMRS